MKSGATIDRGSLPKNFPTHRHANGFWEALGRTVASFGFLEEILGKAIFAFTVTTYVPDDQQEATFEKWLLTLDKALKDTLGGLIDSYGKAVRTNNNGTIKNLDELLIELRASSELRNVLCHGSWRAPDSQRRSLPLFVNRKGEIFETPIDIVYLQQVQQHVTDLVCSVIDSVTQMGLQFPGSSGPGIAIFTDD